MKRNFHVNVLLALLAILGVGALFGGGVLIAAPSGAIFGMPLSMLAYSPFNDFLIPGIILFSLLGLVPIGLIFALIKKPEYRLFELFNLYRDMHWAWTYSIFTAFFLIIWIHAEMVFLRAVHWSHTLYMAFAIIILLFALLPGVRNSYRKPP